MTWQAWTFTYWKPFRAWDDGDAGEGVHEPRRSKYIDANQPIRDQDFAIATKAQSHFGSQPERLDKQVMNGHSQR